MPEFAQVDIKEIQSSIPRSTFSEDDIDKLADTILKGGGILYPLILKQTDIDVYEVLDGHFEYYASVKAREKDKRKAEMVNAFVIKAKEEEIIQEQLKALKKSKRRVDSVDVVSIDPIEKPPSSTSQSSTQISNSDWITSFERRLSDIKEELFQTQQSNDSRLKSIENRFAKQGSLLELLNTLEADKLSICLSQYGIPRYEKHAHAICDARKKKKFSDYRDVVESVKGLGDRTMLSIIDGWLRVNQN